MLISKKKQNGISVERFWRKYHQFQTELTCLIGQELGPLLIEAVVVRCLGFYVYYKWCFGYDLWDPTTFWSKVLGSLQGPCQSIHREMFPRLNSPLSSIVVPQRFGRWTPEKPRNSLQQIKHTQRYWPLVCLDFVLTNVFQSHPPTKGLLSAGFFPSTVSVASLFSIFSNDHSFGIRKRIARQMPESTNTQEKPVSSHEFTCLSVQTCSRLNSRDWI